MNPTIKARIESIRRGEVPEGYKRTKIGIVPNEWITNVTLKSICTINPKTEQLPDEFVYIDLESVVEGMLVCKKIMEKSNAPSRAQRVLQANDVIYQMVRPYQRNNYLFCHESKSYKYVASTGYAQLRAKCYAFLYYLINSDYFCVQVLKKCTGSNYPAIDSEDLASISITYPKKEAEQEKIAEILAGQDRIIALKEKLLAEKQKQKKYLMQQLLTGKKRLPGFSGEWKKVKLGKCLDEVDLRTTVNNEYDILSVTKDGIVRQTEHFNRQIASTNNIGYKIIKKNQVAFSVLNLWMGSVDVLQNAQIGIISPAYKVFNCVIENLLADFAKYFLRSYEVIWLYNINSETGASVVRKNLDIQSLFNCDIVLPSLNEQTAIAEILSTADKEIELLKKDIEQEKLKKKSLMQLLLTGIVRVDELVS